MLNFLASLPNVDPRNCTMDLVTNPKGNVAEHYVLRTVFPRSENPCYLHGTSYHGLPGILKDGFIDPTDHSLQEFTTKGIYFADDLTSEVFYHGVHTRFISDEDLNKDTAPFCNIILKVACRGQCIAKRSYGECNQIVFPSTATSVQEIHIYRGWCFYNRGFKYFPSVDAETINAWPSMPLVATVTDAQLLTSLEGLASQPASGGGEAAVMKKVINGGTVCNDDKRYGVVRRGRWKKAAGGGGGHDIDKEEKECSGCGDGAGIDEDEEGASREKEDDEEGDNVFNHGFGCGGFVLGGGEDAEGDHNVLTTRCHEMFYEPVD